MKRSPDLKPCIFIIKEGSYWSFFVYVRSVGTRCSDVVRLKTHSRSEKANCKCSVSENPGLLVRRPRLN